MWFLPLVVVALLNTPAASPPVYGNPPAVAASPLEKQLTATLPKGAIVDPALSRAAREIAGRALSASELSTATDPTALRLALARAGAVAPEVAPMIAKGSRHKALEHMAGAQREQKGPTRYGVGAAEGEAVALVILSAPDRLSLDPFPVQVEVGSVHVFSGKLRAPLHEREIYVRTPGGTPTRLATGGKAPAFTVPISFAVPGAYTLEVLGHGPRGPEVAAILEVFAGQAIPLAGEGPKREEGAVPVGIAQGEAWTASAINRMRKEKKLPALRVDPTLQKVARRYAEELLATGEFAHRSRLSGDLSDRLGAAGYRFRAAGENLGQAPDVVSAHHTIVDSPGHLANLLSTKWEAMGVGVAEGGSGKEKTVILVEVFASPR